MGILKTDRQVHLQQSRGQKRNWKEKRDMVTNEIRLNEDSRRVQKTVQQTQQGQWTNWDNALHKSLTWKDIWQMVPLRISFLIGSVYNLLPFNANLIGGQRKRTLLVRYNTKADRPQSISWTLAKSHFHRCNTHGYSPSETFRNY